MLPADWNKPPPLDPIGLEKSQRIDEELRHSRVAALTKSARCLLLAPMRDDALRKRSVSRFANGKFESKGQAGEIESMCLGKKLPKVMQYIEPDVLLYLFSVSSDARASEQSDVLEEVRRCLAQIAPSKNCALSFIVVESEQSSSQRESVLPDMVALPLAQRRDALEARIAQVVKSATPGHSPHSIRFAYAASSSSDDELSECLLENIVRSTSALLQSLTVRAAPKYSSETLPSARAVALSGPAWLRRAMESLA